MRILLIDCTERHRGGATTVVADGLATALRARGVEVQRTSEGHTAQGHDVSVTVDFWYHYHKERHLQPASRSVLRCYFAANVPWNRRLAGITIPGEFDVLMHPLEEVCEQWNRGDFPGSHRFTPAELAKRCHYVPRGASSDLLALGPKHRHPTLIVDAEARFAKAGWSHYDSVFRACALLRLGGIPVRSYLLGALDRRATVSLPARVSPEWMRMLYGDAWIYVTNLKGSYELPVIEAQMAGAHVLSLRHRKTDQEAAYRELYRAGVSGVSVANRVLPVALALRKLIGQYDPAAPRGFALHNHSWARSAEMMLEVLRAFV